MSSERDWSDLLALAVYAVRRGVYEARGKHPGPIRGPHEAWGVIEEEWMEARQAIMDSSSEGLAEELVQVAAMCLRALVDLDLVGHLPHLDDWDEDSP